MKNKILFSLRKSILSLLLFILCSSYLKAQNAIDPDPTFNIGTGAGNGVFTSTIQPDGKIIIGGVFASYNGTAINRIARLNSDGSLDNTFIVGSASNSSIWATALQPDGKIIIGGDFTSYNGTPRNMVARLNADGTLDPTFSAAILGSVKNIVLQPDGKIILGGQFVEGIIRLNANGTLDNTFSIGSGTDNGVLTTILQPDGKIIIGGAFTSYNGTAINRIARLNADGTLDNSFIAGSGAGYTVETAVLQPDGKIIIGGGFTSYNNFPVNGIARLNPNGTLDVTFNLGSGINGDVTTAALQSDGKIIIGGYLTDYNGTPIHNIARLNVDGILDITFNVGSGFNNWIYSLAIQSDGKLIVGGYFATFKGLAYNSIIRLQGDLIHYNTIKGNIFTDVNHDCNLQLSEKPISSVIVKALPGHFYGGSDAYGNYQLRVDSGSVPYTIAQEYNSINSKLLLNQCASTHIVHLTGASKDTCCFNFADSVKQCSLLDIQIRKTRARRCFRNVTYINYSNYGSSSAIGAEVKVEYPSDFIPLNSVPAWTSKQGSVLTYNIGTIASGTSGQIIITDSVACVAGITGLTECIRASISPASNCVAENPAWDKSSMKVTGNCDNGNARFVIKNAGSGDMGSNLAFRIYVNDTLIYTGSYKLNSGDSLVVNYPTAGQTIRLEADQHALHPGKSRPRASIENCGVAATEVRGLIITAPQDDLDEEVASTCNMIIDSYDPNDKQAFPSGTGPAHNIPPGEELEYVIRFQNTGTDTAYTVTVVDTLDSGLDVASFTKGASSHPYTLGISGKGQAVLSFRFDQINLPDKTTDELNSNGLVSFRITVPSSAAIGTVIKNKAHIIFDYNDPVITNETMHTVDTVTYKDFSKGSAVTFGSTTLDGLNSKRSKQTAKIYPNPTAGMITVEMPEPGNNTEMRILSLVGSLQKTVALSSSVQQVNLEDLNQGMYLYEVWQNGERKAGGKLQIWF